MASKFHAHDALIQAIGPGAIRAHFGLTPQGFYAWRIRGIPYAQRGVFAQLAAVHGVATPGDFFAPPVKVAA